MPSVKGSLLLYAFVTMYKSVILRYTWASALIEDLKTLYSRSALTL